MPDDLGRDLGEQPIAGILLSLQLKAHDLVAASTEHLTHKMVARACKGRRLTANVQGKIVRAVNKAGAANYRSVDLFSY